MKWHFIDYTWVTYKIRIDFRKSESDFDRFSGNDKLTLDLTLFEST